MKDFLHGRGVQTSAAAASICTTSGSAPACRSPSRNRDVAADLERVLDNSGDQQIWFTRVETTCASINGPSACEAKLKERRVPACRARV